MAKCGNSEKQLCCLETGGKAVVSDVTRLWGKLKQMSFQRLHYDRPWVPTLLILPSESSCRDFYKCLAYLPFCSIRRLSYNDCISVIWNLDLGEK